MHTQDKFVQIANELPMIVGFPGCEVRAMGLSYGVQRPKGGVDEPTVGDKFLSMGKALACFPLIERCIRGQVGVCGSGEEEGRKITYYFSYHFIAALVIRISNGPAMCWGYSTRAEVQFWLFTPKC